MSTVSQNPDPKSTPTPGSSPLVDRIGTDVTQINIVPGFGNLLQVVLHGSTGMPEVMPGAVAAVTVYGDGRIEYHPLPVDSADASGCKCGPQLRCPQGHCSRHHMCQDCGNCCTCDCAGGVS